MEIISKYKDYYDGTVGYGIDKTIRYERTVSGIETPKEFDKIVSQFSPDSYWRSYNYGFVPSDNVNVVVIGFCGKLYLGIEFSKTIKSKNPMVEDKIVKEIIYDIETIKEKLKPLWKKRVRYVYNYKPKDKEVEFDNYVAKLNGTDASEWFRKYNTPIFAWGSWGINEGVRWHEQLDLNSALIFNPILKDYQFARVFDPYTAFQEIQMYISGVLGVNDLDGKGMPMTEKQKVGQHGMDKWSFRKPPSK